MKKKQKITGFLRWLQELTTKPVVRTFIITLLSWLISHTIIYDITSASIFTPIEKSNDFELSDIYNVVADARPVRTLNSDIVIVGIDQCSREDIGELVCMINAVKPKAMGLDVFFGFSTDNDTAIIETFNSCNNLVLACDALEQLETVFAPQLYSVKWGAINFFTKKNAGTVRMFRPMFGDSLYSFSAEIARIANPSAFKRLIERGNDLETICFPSQEYMVMDGVDILYGEYVDSSLLGDMLSGKIVLMGDIHNPLDNHLTPINADMPGIIINAHVLSTILQGTFVDSPNENVNWMFAMFISLLFSSIIVGCQVNPRIKPYTTFILRSSQILLMVAFIYAGCIMFAKWHFYCNFSLALMMIGLGILASAFEPLVGVTIRKSIGFVGNVDTYPTRVKYLYRIANRKVQNHLKKDKDKK